MNGVMTLTQSRIRQGGWEGMLTGHSGGGPPTLSAHHMDRPLEDMQFLQVDEAEGSWQVKLKIPTECLNEGVQNFVIEDAEKGETLTHFAIIAGAPVDDQIVAEVALLRAELDMLKRAFRRFVGDS